MIEIVRDDEYSEDFRAVFDKLEERVRDHKNRGNIIKAKQLVTKVWHQVLQIDDEFWKEQYLGELERRFGDLIQVPEDMRKEIKDD